MRRLLLLFLLLSSPAYAAGFDCGKAANDVERLVCSDQALSYYDRRLNYEYRKGLAKSSDTRAYVEEQKRWLSDSRDRCTDVACLVGVYFDRLEALRSFSVQADEHVSSETKSVAVVCERKGRFILVRNRRERDDSFYLKESLQVHAVPWKDLLINGPPSPSDDYVYRAGSRTRVQRCGSFLATITYGYLNRDPMGEQGADSFPEVSLQWNKQLIVPSLRLATCPESLPMWSPCPDGYALAVAAFWRPGDQRPEVVIERRWEGPSNKARFRADVQSPR
jgi:uncharacterized protein YecT (DUF1311 family)